MYADNWRRARRYAEIYQRAVYQGLQVIRGEDLWAQGLCPICGVSVSLNQRTDSLSCSAQQFSARRA